MRSEYARARWYRVHASAMLWTAGICVGWLVSGGMSDAGEMAAPPIRSGPTVQCRHGVVVSVSAPASRVGVEILRHGGNAVDAAVATAFALAVTWPEAGNIGGGGFMLVFPGPASGAEPIVIDYRETAPAAATADMFVTGRRSSYTLVGVPGTVRGLALAQQKFGRLPWREVVLPAIKLARGGFDIDASLARAINDVVRTSPDFLELRRVFGQKSVWRAGDRFIQPDLAETLQAIADQGPDAFYTGSIAKLLVDDVRRGRGIITASDLAQYQAKIRRPVRGTFRGYEVYASPPPSSGGVALVEMLNVLENFELKEYGRFDPRTLHLMVESMRRAYCDRARYLGDPDFAAIPAELTSKPYAKRLASGIDPMRATRSEDLARQDGITLFWEGNQTTHLSVIDEQGMAVSNTYTLEESFGGRIMVKGAGFLLNNEMGDFNPRPGVTDRHGLIGTPPNQVAPGRRMLSSMCPAIVAKDGRAVLVTGSPGGRTIINTVLCVTLNYLEFDMPPREAVDAPRMHHPWFPDELEFEPGLLRDHAAAIESLKRMGHAIGSRPARQGDAHTIWLDPPTGEYIGVADQRVSGAAAGY